MLTNASILRIDRKGGLTATGQPKVATGNAIAAGVARCFMDGVTTRQRYAMGAIIEDADTTCLVLLRSIAVVAETRPDVGDRMMIVLDGTGQVAKLHEVIIANDRVLPGGGGNSHIEIFLRRLPLAPGVSI